MLISFSVENWMSFRDNSTLCMLASEETKHIDTVPTISNHEINVLPIAIIYGGNASGKTSLFKALYFMQWFIVNRSTQLDSPIEVEPFLLWEQHDSRPTRFDIELLINDELYKFSFSVSRFEVLEERLIKIENNEGELVLYKRVKNKINSPKRLDPTLQLIANTTPRNQLFLTTSVFAQATSFKPIYDWFKDTLELISPDATFIPTELFFDKENSFYNAISQKLVELDTNIAALEGKQISLDALPRTLVQEIKSDPRETLRFQYNKERYIASKNAEELQIKKLITLHTREDGRSIEFETSMESDGSKRIIDLLPAFCELEKKNSNKVYFIDEIDRSLHHLLTRNLIQSYLKSCTHDSRSQLLITSHDLLMLDTNLFRDDEIWLIERDAGGVSGLASLIEYNEPSSGKNRVQRYLQGKYGGVPNLFEEWSRSDDS